MLDFLGCFLNIWGISLELQLEIKSEWFKSQIKKCQILSQLFY